MYEKYSVMAEYKMSFEEYAILFHQIEREDIIKFINMLPK
jgi:hypothetical protein